MSTKFTLLIIFMLSTVFISGCIFNKDTGTAGTNSSKKMDLIPQTNLPSGFTYMGTHETEVDIGDSSLKATEGVYRTDKGDDAYIQVIEHDKPDSLVTMYKERYNNVKYNPFLEISFNNHPATQVTDYSTINGQQKPNYLVMWTTEKALILVSSPTTDAENVVALATATGS